MYRQFTKELIQLKEFRLHELFKSEDDRWVATLKPVELHNRCTGCDVKRIFTTGNHERYVISGFQDVAIYMCRYRFIAFVVLSAVLHGLVTGKWCSQRGHVTEHFKATVTEYCFGKTIQEVANIC